MTVENRERPHRQHQEAGHGEQDAHAGDGEGEAIHRRRAGRHPRGVAMESQRENEDDGPRQNVAEQGDAGRHGQHQSEDGAREPAGFLFFSFHQEPAVDRNEGS